MAAERTQMKVRKVSTPMRAVLAPVALALLLAGCADMRKSMFGKAVPPPPCPRVSILPDAETITTFKAGPGRDLIDVVGEGQLVDAIGACEHKIDKETDAGTLDIELQVAMEARRGPAERDHRVSLDYFVTLLDGASTAILQKNTFRVTVEFPGNRSVAQVLDSPVGLTIPLKAGQRGADFQILLGFQLTPDELEFNRQSARP